MAKKSSKKAAKKRTARTASATVPTEASDVEVSEPTTRAELETVIRSIKRTCRGPLSAESAARRDEFLAMGLFDAAKELDANRAGCGYDFNETILANPLDGQDHIVTCPQCGGETSYRAPGPTER